MELDVVGGINALPVDPRARARVEKAIKASRELPLSATVDVVAMKTAVELQEVQNA
jgi:hypothetical protein